MPHGGDWNAFRLGKLQSLCKACHDRIKRNIELDGYSSAVGIDGLPLDGNHPIYQTAQFKECLTGEPPQHRSSYRAIKSYLKHHSRSTDDELDDDADGDQGTA